jgi:hypothetical protein
MPEPVSNGTFRYDMKDSRAELMVMTGRVKHYLRSVEAMQTRSYRLVPMDVYRCVDGEM